MTAGLWRLLEEAEPDNVRPAHPEAQVQGRGATVFSLSVTAPNSAWSLEADGENAPVGKKGRKSGRGQKGSRSGSHKRKGGDYVYSSDSEYEGY